MIDTMVLSFGITNPKDSGLDEELREKVRSSIFLIKNSGDNIAISSITWLELLRCLDKKQEKKCKSLLGNKIRIEGVDGRVAEKAVNLISEIQKSPDFCNKCLIPKKRENCKHCGLPTAGLSRINDLIIIATAEVNSDIKELYTYDEPMIKLQQYIKNCKISKPPSCDGPLFEDERRLDKKVISIKR